MIVEEKGTSEEKEKPKLIIEQPSETGLKQIPIYSQNDVGGEGEASSGYHALLRAMQVVKYKGLSKKDTFFFETKALKEHEPTVVEVFFGKKQNTQQEENGTWRQAIIDQREKESKVSANGDWLEPEEITFLWNLGKNDVNFDVLKKFTCILHVVDIPFERTPLFILGRIKPLLNQKKPFFVIFMLHTKHLLHWYSLVMYQNQEGKRQYYIMDSDNNADRLQDENAWKIINLIEK